jgi:hypothetical protein
MTATFEAPASSLAATTTSTWDHLRIEREDIAFSSRSPKRLAVSLTITNIGLQPTARTFAVVRSAPLGAFVPWQPLDVVDIPSLEPGEAVVEWKDYAISPARALGGMDKIPPERVLTALGLGEPEEARKPTSNFGLAMDLMALVGQGGVHWAGNLNLFFPGHDVERHVAQALRIYPGRVNLAMFIVGSWIEEEYRFALTGHATAWNARLYDTLRGQPIVAGATETEALDEGTWMRPSTGMLLLAVEPPADAQQGAVNVHVRQRSSQREAVVEFTMDASAAGPGCYVL